MILSFCVTHKKASIPMLESLAFNDKKRALKALCSLDVIQECVLIQTCNRVETHIVTHEPSIDEVTDRLVSFWSQTAKVSKDLILDAIEVFEGREALHHLLLLASGLESMVVGEDQILGQIRDAYLESKEAGASKSIFNTVFTKAMKVGRKVRTETGLNKGSLSISSVTISLAEKYLGNLKCAKALVIGAGKAGTLAARELSRKGIGSVFVANRTYDRGVALAKIVGGEAIRFEEIHDYISKVNLVIVATSATTPILTSDSVNGLLNGVDKSPGLLIIDISQPRCVEEAVGCIPNIDLKSIDDLRDIVNENLHKRLNKVSKAKEIVLKELRRVEVLLKRMVAEPTISSLCRKAEGIRCIELSKALHMIKGINEDQLVIIEDLTKQLTEKILQFPIENLRNAALNGDQKLLLAASKLFDLRVNSSATKTDMKIVRAREKRSH